MDENILQEEYCEQGDFMKTLLKTGWRGYISGKTRKSERIGLCRGLSRSEMIARFPVAVALIQGFLILSKQLVVYRK